MPSLLTTVCNSVERACLIAVQLKLFMRTSLIESKEDRLKNENVAADFKTFTDVLIQQVITRDIENKFNSLSGKIYGEESDKIKVNGTIVTVKLSSSDTDLSCTKSTLRKVLGESSEQVDTLTNIIHRIGEYSDDCWKDTDFPCFDLDLDEVGFWIDPIDSTNQYIQASVQDNVDFDNSVIIKSGLPCVTCLVGAFDLLTGNPLLGVVAQPFVKPHRSYRPKINSCFNSELFWGINLSALKATNIIPPLDDTRSTCSKLTAVVSSSSQWLVEKTSPEFEASWTSGAGYKCLSAILGLSHCYLNASGGTYFWDLCGPHAILAALGGQMISFKQLIEEGKQESLKYRAPSHFPLEDISECSVKDGFVAMRCSDLVLQKLKTCLSS